MVLPPAVGRGAARLAESALVIWVALTLNFALPRLAPGDPLNYLFGQEANALSPAQKQRVLRELGLDRSIPEQYAGYFTGILRGDLGRSVRFRAPVIDVLADRVPWTLLLVLPSLFLTAIVGTTLGALAAWRRGSARDLGLLAGMLALESMPVFWTGMILISIFAVQLGWLPSFGATPLAAGDSHALLVLGIAKRMILPVATLTLAGVGAIFLLTRASMLTTLGDDYVIMAQAKGLTDRRVLFGHALRNALLPVYTSLTLSLGAVASGAVVVETVFSYPGLGRVIYEGVLARDYPLLQGAFLLVTLGVVGANLLADATYPLLDPRIRRSGGLLTDARTASGSRVGLVGVALLLIVSGAALLAPLLAPYDPWRQVTAPFARPSMAHPLGANDAGQDVLSELIYGARVSLLIGVLAAVMATLVGTTVGLAAGFFRGITDIVLMRCVDVLLSLPFLPLMIVLGVCAGPGLFTEIVVIGAVIWARTAREIRAQVLSLRERSYVEGARAMGARPLYVLTRHLAPAVAPLVIPQLVRAATLAILLDASLSFLGLGDPGAKSWGTMLYYANARSAFLTDAWLWWVLPPGLCIGAVVLGFALVGYALEERARPRLRTFGAGRTIRTSVEQTTTPAVALAVENLTVEYVTPGGALRAVADVSFTIRRGDALGIVGESGSGKTTLVTTVLGLLQPPARIASGRVLPVDLPRLRGKTVALIPQGAMNALDPVMSIGDQIAEAIAAYSSLGRAARRARVSELLTIVGIPPERGRAYPHEFSAGMRQRVVIAMALANDPDLVVADEPTTGLDLIVQAEILTLLSDLRARLGLALLFISHDLPVVLRVVDRLAVMYRGQIVEEGPARAIVAKPSHACTKRMVDAVPRLRGLSAPDVDSRPSDAPALEIVAVRKSFRGRGRRAPRHVVLDGVSLAVGAGEAVGLVGGSGVGKSTIARLAVGLEQPDAGKILFEGREVWHDRGDAVRAARQRLHLVFQDPYDALPPSMRVQEIVAEPLAIHSVGTRTERTARVREALEETALTPADRFLGRYAHELSGGERQRVALARAIVLRPRLIVADEPTTMLDMSLRLELLALMQRLGRQHAIGYLYITHDLALARAFCDRLVILCEGHVVEHGPAADLLERPAHPYTKRLVAAAVTLPEA